jgi:hypothetical protein
MEPVALLLIDLDWILHSQAMFMACSWLVHGLQATNACHSVQASMQNGGLSTPACGWCT